MSAAPKLHMRSAAEDVLQDQARRRAELTKAAVQGLCAAAGAGWADANAERIAARAVRIADATQAELTRVEGRRHASR
ncbi:hypothetical protein [Dyella sp.]|uniref:hypothetical protein n=1 Tax=Dyella sp. TaxID=1869338 RepID=UPI003F7E23F9